jgi:hypothetical protein
VGKTLGSKCRGLDRRSRAIGATLERPGLERVRDLAAEGHQAVLV